MRSGFNCRLHKRAFRRSVDVVATSGPQLKQSNCAGGCQISSATVGGWSPRADVRLKVDVCGEDKPESAYRPLSFARGHFGSRRGAHPGARSMTTTNRWCQRVDFSPRILIWRTPWEPSGSRGKKLKSLPSASKNTAPGPWSLVRA